MTFVTVHVHTLLFLLLGDASWSQVLIPGTVQVCTTITLGVKFPDEPYPSIDTFCMYRSGAVHLLYSNLGPAWAKMLGAFDGLSCSF